MIHIMMSITMAAIVISLNDDRRDVIDKMHVNKRRSIVGVISLNDDRRDVIHKSKNINICTQGFQPASALPKRFLR